MIFSEGGNLVDFDHKEREFQDHWLNTRYFFCFYRVLVRLERDLFRAFEFDTHPIKMSPLQMPLRFLKFCIIQFILLFVWS